MKSVHPIAATVNEPASVIGAKAHGLITLRRLGLPVPPGFVIPAGAIPDKSELDAAVAGLEAATGRRFGDSLTVSVRSGASVSMPGMMDTILNVASKPALAAAIREVVESWDTPRAKTYRDLHGIPHSLGTAVTVQAMVFGDRDAHSGTGVAFSRNPNTGSPTPYGEVLFGRQGDAVVSGTETTLPLSELDSREPAVWAALVDALARIEGHYRDACHVEFTFESGELWLLQVRAGGFVGRAAIRVAVDLADSGAISQQEAVLRVSPSHFEYPPTIEAAEVFTCGLGASPGVATGRIATTSNKAVQMAASGPVILVRPHTSPLDMHGLAASAGVVTARGGPTSHAAVVARSMRKPAVVGAQLDLAEGTVITIDGSSGEIVLGTAKVVTAETDSYLHRLRDWHG